MFVKLLKYNSSFAHVFGSIEFDFEVVKRREEKRENEENGEKRREWEKREEGGFVKAERRENEDSLLAEEEERNDDDDFEDVYVIRRCSIETFYRVVVPALRQITERYENREQNEETAGQIEENEDNIPREDRGVAGEGGDQLAFAALDQGAAIVVAVVAGAPVEAGVHDCWVRSS